MHLERSCEIGVRLLDHVDSADLLGELPQPSARKWVREAELERRRVRQRLANVLVDDPGTDDAHCRIANLHLVAAALICEVLQSL